MNKLKERFKSFTPLRWVSVAFMFVATVFILYMSISSIVSVASGNTLYGGKNSSDFFAKYGDVTMNVLIALVAAFMVALFVYTLFFRKFDNTPVTKKVIDHGRVIEADEQIQDPDKIISDDKPVMPKVVISEDKLKSLEKEIKAKEDKKEDSNL